MVMFTMAEHSTLQTPSRALQSEQNDWHSLGSGLQLAYMPIGRTETLAVHIDQMKVIELQLREPPSPRRLLFRQLN